MNANAWILNMKTIAYSKKIIFLILPLLFCVALTCRSEGKEMKKEIWFAGGCFWGVQEYFSRLPGVLATETGYANSRVANPGYRQVCAGNTGAAETVKVAYDPQKIDLATLIKKFFAIIDPLSVNRQGNDIGDQYRTGIYYADPADKPIIDEAYAEEQGGYGRPLAVEVLPLSNFYPAEDYHQDYLKKNPGGYCHINLDKASENPEEAIPDKNYVKPADDVLREKLTPMQYAVTQKAATEPAFSGQHWNRHEDGIYVDIVTGEPLFTSKAKFDSGTGWASFTKAIDSRAILGSLDSSHGMRRIEARSRHGHSHLGHIFPDGPTGLRYCINDAALKFIPKADMEKEGYGYLLKLLN